MDKTITRFLSFLVEERNSTENTLAAYRNDLNQFSRYVQGVGSTRRQRIGAWSELTPKIIQNYLTYLKRQKYASSTIARKIATIKNYCQFLTRIDLLSEDPSVRLEPPKVKKNLPRPIRPEEVKRLLAAPIHYRSTTSLRDKALMETLYATGMRVTELVELNLDNISIKDKTVTCGADTQRERIVPIHGSTVEALREYIDERQRSLQIKPHEVALFLNHRGERLTRQGLWLIIKRYVKEVGINEQVTPHTLRHSFAAHLLNSGANLQELQERLGHANLSTTQIYRQVSSKSSE